MGYNDCKKHDWKIHAPAVHTSASDSPTYVLCEKCHLTMTLAEVKQLEAVEKQTEAVKNQTESVKLQEGAYNHMIGFQRTWSIWTLAISVIAICISIFSLFRK